MDPDQYDKLRALAKRYETTIRALVREALPMLFEKKEL